MIFRKISRAGLFGAALAAGMALSSPVMAADAYASFDGTQGAGGFRYGSTDGTNFSEFSNASNANCQITNSVCLQRDTINQPGVDYLPGVYKSTVGATTFGTVIVPASSLVLHPGPNNAGGSNLQSVYVAFKAATSGVYNYSAAFRVADTSPSGVGISSFTISGVTSLFSLSGSSPLFSTSGSISLAANEVFGFIVDKGSFYNNDSTAVDFTISAAPEPATWAMMIGGFGMAGVALRRRKPQVRVAHA